MDVCVLNVCRESLVCVCVEWSLVLFGCYVIGACVDEGTKEDW